ncbi:MAG TPA: 2-phosphosulfolactate phosphatase [Gemmatimonadales bacterium]|nr:2-phosphosulfolactate phosphatase [Gemmatimonadales bacterium]
MKIDVFFTHQAVGPADVQGRTVVVIDVLRTTTTIAVALHNGARAVLPAGSTEEALRIAQNLERDQVVLAGERRSTRIPGFALGNSPHEFTEDAVRGKTIVLATTNGTPALIGAQGAREVLVGAAVNFGVLVAHCRRVLEERAELMIVCSGREKQFALEDAFAAGRLTKVLLPEGGLRRVKVNDGALASLELARHYGERWLRAFRASQHGQELTALGFSADLRLCAEENTHPVLPIYADRRITTAAQRAAQEG